MDALIPALAALAAALAAWLRLETAERRARARRRALEERMTDVQHLAGADRRRNDDELDD